MFKYALCSLIMGMSLTVMAAPARKILFFSKSSGFEHSVISWGGGQPSFADKIFTQLGEKHPWTFEFSKDGSKFSPAYLAEFDTVIFYTTGDLTTTGTDGQPAMTPAGKQALLDYVKSGKGFIGLHSATDTFHTDKDGGLIPTSDKDAFICLIGGEFVGHGDQQEATNAVIDPKFPGFASAGKSFRFHEEWYAFKNFNPDMHALTVIDSRTMKGDQYKQPPYPTTWARQEGKGRVYYTAMGHREDIWTNPVFQDMLVGAIRWTSGDVKADISANLKKVAPSAIPAAASAK
jgi:type 1 glutamine amidotransferase